MRKYSIDENTPNVTMIYGNLYKNAYNTPFGLLIENDDGRDVYLLDNMDKSNGFVIGRIESKFYEEPENFSLPYEFFTLRKVREFSTEYSHWEYRMIHVENMNEFEEHIYHGLISSYNVLTGHEDINLLEPGDIGITKDSELILYLGKYNQAKFIIENFDSSIETIDDAKTEIPKNKATKEITENINIYITLNTLDSKIKPYSNENVLEEISPQEFEEMISTVIARKQRIKVVEKLEGNLNFLYFNEDDYEELSFYINPTPFNNYHKETVQNIFGYPNSRSLYGDDNNNQTHIKQNNIRQMTIKLGKLI